MPKQMIDELAAAYPDHALIPYGRGELALLAGDTETGLSLNLKRQLRKTRFLTSR